MIAANNVTLRVGKKALFEDVNIKFTEGNCYGMIGANGAGKSTFLKILSGQLEPTNGDVTITPGQRLSFLEQDHFKYDSYPVLDTVIMGNARLYEIMKEKEALYAKEDFTDEDGIKASELEGEFAEMNGWEAETDAEQLLNGLGIEPELHYAQMADLTGSQKVKVLLARALFGNPDILLLDEPTNHLDLEAIEWLENYLCAYKKSCVIVSHDRMFLDKIVNVVYEIEYGMATRYTGNYSAFMAQKQQAYDKALKDSMARKKEIERLNALVERFRYKASKAAMAQAKLKQIERIGDVNAPNPFNVSTFRGAFEPERETVEKAIVLDKLVFGYDKPLGEISAVIKRGEKVGIIGNNGTGKSTLVKTVMHLVKAIDGTAIFGLHANVGYFDQTLTQSFSTKTVLEDFQDEFPLLDNTQARSALGAFLFSGDDVFKRICDLSGGEKVRLALCKIIRKRPNTLILDEPTNHMDIIGKETLENLLSGYTGTVMTVSHDRYFINRVCNRLIVFEDGKASVFDGTYSEFEQSRQVAEQTGDNSQTSAPKKKEKPVSESKEIARRKHRMSFLEDKMSVLEEKIAELEDIVHNDETVYSDYKKITELQSEIDELKTALEPLEEEWLELSEKE